jgi:CMP-N,N'-diacetyllegionaminic acid synthase
MSVGELTSPATTLAVIPARGGSKGIPRKNLVDVAGKPLLAWSILAARAATASLRVVVSTDDHEIADTASAFGAEVPFLRPAELATDQASGEAPVLHALEWFDAHENWRPDYIMCLQPTSPLRTAADIDQALRLLEERRADSVVSVTEADPHPYWTKTIDGAGWLRPFAPPGASLLRQDLPEIVALNGAIFVARRQAFVDTRSWYPGLTAPYLMPAERSLDIDTYWHLELANFLLANPQTQS